MHVHGTCKIKNFQLTSEISPVSGTLIKSAKSLSAFLDKKKIKTKKFPWIIANWILLHRESWLLSSYLSQSCSAGRLRPFRTTPKYLGLLQMLLCPPPWLSSYLDLGNFDLPTISNSNPLDMLSQLFLLAEPVPGSWFMGTIERGTRWAWEWGSFFHLFFITYMLLTECLEQATFSCLKLLSHYTIFFFLRFQDRGVQL